MWITNAFQADWMCCLANTRKEGQAHQNKSLICIPMDTKGDYCFINNLCLCSIQIYPLSLYENKEVFVTDNFYDIWPFE